MSETDSDVKEVPNRTCVDEVARAKCWRMRRVRSAMEYWTAVVVGCAARKALSRSTDVVDDDAESCVRSESMNCLADKGTLSCIDTYRTKARIGLPRLLRPAPGLVLSTTQYRTRLLGGR